MPNPSTPTDVNADGGASPADSTTTDCPCPTFVKYTADPETIAFGWDDYTDPGTPWKSVEVCQSDTVTAKITPPEKASAAEFSSADPSIATVSPTAASFQTTLTITGKAKGETEIRCTCRGVEIGKFKVAVYNRKSKTVAVRLVNESNYQSTDLNDGDITARLQKVYRQAVVEFRLTRMPAKTMNFDLDGDGKVNVDFWMSAEMMAIRDFCKDDSFDYNVFLVDHPSDGSFGVCEFNQRYAYVHADSTSTPLKSLSHELGHGQGLEHALGDADNLMNQGQGDNMWRLRKAQWDKLNR